MLRMPPPAHDEVAAAAPFTVLGVVAIVAGGVIAAAVAHRPTQHLVWMVAYLVLVVGVVQYALGAGQVSLSVKAPNPGKAWKQWSLLNVGHVGVIAGTLSGSLILVCAGTACYDAAIVWLVLAVRSAQRGMQLNAYRGLVLIMLISSLVGLALSVSGR